MTWNWKESNKQKHQFRSYYCLDCKQQKPCHTISQEYCCSCAYQIEREKAEEYSNYQQVYQRKEQERKDHIQQLQLLKSYQGCKQCGSPEVDAYSLYSENQLVCQPCRMKKEGGASGSINFLEQQKWFKRFWKIELAEWLEKYDCLPVNAGCAKEWVKDKEHLKNCQCLELEVQETFLLFSNSLKESEAESDLTDKNLEITKLTEDNKFLTDVNRVNREFIEELTEPGIAEKVVKESFKNYPVKSAIGTVALGYLTKEYLKKWRNIPKVEQLEQEKGKLENKESKLIKKIGEMMLKLSQEKDKNKLLTKDFKNAIKKAKEMKDKYGIAKDARKLMYQRIKEIKKFYKEELQKVQNKLPSLALIQYEENSESLESSSQFNNSLQKNFSLMVGKITELTNNGCWPCSQFHSSGHAFPTCNLEHCSHSDYEKLKNHTCPKTCSENYHQKIRLEREKEVIKQINTDCKLGCKEDSNREQIISRIKELISMPGGECLVMIIKLEKESMEGLLSEKLFENYSEKLSKISDYSQLVTQRRGIIEEALVENQQVATVNPAGNGLINSKTVLAGSLIITLLTVGGMVWFKSRKNKGGSLPIRSGGKVATLPTQINKYLVANGIKSLEVDEEGEVRIRLRESSVS